MPKDIASDERYINDQLAEFADKVIEGEEFQRLTSEDSTILSGLQEVILEVHRSVSHTTGPDRRNLFTTPDRLAVHHSAQAQTGQSSRPGRYHRNGIPHPVYTIAGIAARRRNGEQRRGDGHLHPYHRRFNHSMVSVES
jgi:hypothetical protein